MSSTPFSLRYVVLRHEGTEHPHYDLLFETAPGSMLATWRADTWPVATGDIFLRLRDHRRFYLDYEGELSADRGSVTRIEAGTHLVIQNNEEFFATTCREGLELQLQRQANRDHWRCRVNEM